MNMKRIGAIFEKDLKDFMKNSTLLFMPILPIILSILYSRMGQGEEMPLMMIYVVVGIAFSTVTAGLIMMMMAEENEKNTLRGLMMSPASFADIIVGKSLVTGLLTFISLVISLLIIGIDPLLNVKAMIGLILLFLFFLFIGITGGLFAKTVGITTAYLMPIMFLFGFTPMIEFLGFAEGSLTMKIAHYFPILQLIHMHEVDSWRPLGIVLLWTIAFILLAFICFRKLKKDD